MKKELYIFLVRSLKGILEGTARYTDLLLAPLEVLQPCNLYALLDHFRPFLVFGSNLNT